MSSNTQDRRTFLKRSLLGGAVLVAGSGTLIALRKGNIVSAPPPLASFDPAVYAVVLAVVARMVPLPDADPAVIALGMDDALTYTPPTLRGDINKVLSLLENGLGGLFTRGSITPFTLLTVEGQDRALMAWRDSRLEPLTAAYHALRKLSFSVYYGDLDAARQVGYPGPFFDKPDAGPLHPRAPISKPFVPKAPAVPEKNK